jgi:hypothetical protein
MVKYSGMQCKHMMVPLLMLAFFLFGAANMARATDYKWNGSRSSDWFDGRNWTPQGVPGQFDSAVVDISYPDPTISQATSVRALSIANTGADIHGGPLTVTESFTWQAGYLSATVHMASGATTTILGANGVSLPGSLNNAGTINWIGIGNIRGNGIINNTGTLNVQTDADFDSSISFNNAGLVRKFGTTNQSVFDVASFVNSGGVLVENGSLYLDAGRSTANSVFHVAADCSVGLENYTINAGTVFRGAGKTFIAGDRDVLSGTSTIEAGATVEITRNQKLTGTDAALFEGNGTIVWTGGRLDGAITLGSGIGTLIRGTDTIAVDGTINNYGTVNWIGLNYIDGEGTFNNNGVFNASNDATMGDYFARVIFNNNGTFNKVAGTQNTTFGWNFNNAGAVNVHSGTLWLRGGGSSTGTFNTAPGSVISLANHHLNAGAVITGSGRTQVSGNSTVTVHGALTVAAGAVLEVSSDDVLLGTDNAALIGSGTFSWIGGSIHGVIGIGDAITTNLTGTNDVAVEGTVNSYGTVNWIGLNFIGGEGTFYNNGIFNALNDAAFGNGYTVGTFNNNGTFNKAAGTQNTTFGWNFNSAGTVNVQTGNLIFERGFNQTAGITRLAGGNIRGTVNLNGGALAGTGTVDGNLNNGALVSPGHSPGSLRVTGNYTQSPSGTLNIELAGTGAGSDYDQLQVGEHASLNGTLNIVPINGFVPASGHQFMVVTWPENEREGTFAAINGRDLGSGRTLNADYYNSELRLTARALPSIIDVSPWSGFVGSAVAISGHNLSDVNEVYFNGYSAAILQREAGKVVVQVPASATSGFITVYNSSGSARSATSFAVLPRILSISPRVAPVGAYITINGSGFDNLRAVRFNGAGALFTRVSSTRISAKVPSTATAGKITVTTSSGTATSADTFIVASSIVSFAPAAGPTGTPVLITGSVLAGTSAVRFNGVTARFTRISASQVRAFVPASATSGKITISTPAGAAVSATNFLVTPRITGFSPSHGFVGTRVIITGTSLTGTTAVRFGGVSATFARLSPTQVQAVVPANALSGKISLTTPSGTGFSVASFSVLPRIINFSPASGPVGTVITINGNGFTGTRAVTLAGRGMSLLSVSPTQLRVRVPTGASTGKISVSTTGGTSTTLGNFMVVAAISRGTTIPEDTSAGTAVPVSAEQIAISSAKAVSTDATVRLTLLHAINSQLMDELANCVISVNGQVVEVESFSYDQSTSTLAFGLPMGILQPGDMVTVKSKVIKEFTPIYAK